MHKNIVDKINYEYMLFEMQMIRTSKENIFANVYEIHLKKEIKRIINSKGFDKYNTNMLLLANENLLELLYNKLSDGREYVENSISEVVEELLNVQ